MTVEDIARACHEVNRAFCAGLGDTSQPAWAEAPEWQKQSAVNGVKFHLDGLAQASFGYGPAASHENWLREKLDAGWKYGPVKDVEKREHPCCVPYNELPIEQRAKDQLFIGVVHGMAHLLQ